MKLYLVDGSSYIYRAYHAIKSLNTSKGVPTNAVYGFTTTLMKILREKKPDGIAVVFDTPAPTERHRMFEAYKAQRPEAPGDLVAQIPAVKDVISAFRIVTFEMPGYEADDIIGTLAKSASGQGAQVFIVTGDKDMLQLVDERIVVYDPIKDTIADSARVQERFGVPPSRVPEVMALTGDPIDNIPGVKGIGEKTARDLLASGAGLDELLDHPEMIKNDRIRALVTENAAAVRLSKSLATINTAVPVETSLQDLARRDPDWPALLRLFTDFEFTSLIRLVPAEGYRQRGRYRTVTTREELLEFLGPAS